MSALVQNDSVKSLPWTEHERSPNSLEPTQEQADSPSYGRPLSASRISQVDSLRETFYSLLADFLPVCSRYSPKLTLGVPFSVPGPCLWTSCPASLAPIFGYRERLCQLDTQYRPFLPYSEISREVHPLPLECCPHFLRVLLPSVKNKFAD